MADRQHDAGSKTRGSEMIDRYTVIHPDTLEAMRRAGHVAKLEASIEKLEARILLLEGWLNGSLNVIEAFVACDTKEAREALEGKDE